MSKRQRGGVLDSKDQLETPGPGAYEVSNDKSSPNISYILAETSFEKNSKPFGSSIPRFRYKDAQNSSGINNLMRRDEEQYSLRNEPHDFKKTVLRETLHILKKID